MIFGSNVHSKILTVAYVKKLAKRIKRERHVNHSTALELAAQAFGFEDWQHFLKSVKESEKSL